VIERVVPDQAMTNDIWESIVQTHAVRLAGSPAGAAAARVRVGTSTAWGTRVDAGDLPQALAGS